MPAVLPVFDVRKACLDASAANYEHPGPAIEKEWSYGSYRYSLSSRAEDRVEGVRHKERFVAQQLQSMGIPVKDAGDIERYFTGASTGRGLPVYSSQVASIFGKYVDGGSYMRGDITKLKIGASLACRDATPGCAGALREIADITYPLSRPDGAMALIPVFREVATRPVYSRVLSRLYLTMQNRLRDEISQTAPGAPTRLLDDVRAAARSVAAESGLSDSEAEEWSWNILALYGARGAAAYPYALVANRENAPAMFGLFLVSGIIPALDAYALAHGSSYSLPEGYRSDCDFTRTYHFWLPAYLARALKAKGREPGDIFAALHALDVAYEQFSKVATKQPLDLVAAGPVHSAYKIELRKNIAFNDSGAAFGLGGDAARCGADSIDRNFVAMNRQASAAPGRERSQLMGALSGIIGSVTGYDPDLVFTWREKMAPDALFPELLRCVRGEAKRP